MYYSKLTSDIREVQWYQIGLFPKGDVYEYRMDSRTVISHNTVYRRNGGNGRSPGLPFFPRSHVGPKYGSQFVPKNVRPKVGGRFYKMLIYSNIRGIVAGNEEIQRRAGDKRASYLTRGLP